MLVKLANFKIENMHNAAVSLINSGTVLPTKTVFRIAMNIEAFATVVNKLNEARNSNVTNNDFQQFRKDFFEERCIRDENGEIVVENGGYTFKDQKAVQKEFEAAVIEKFGDDLPNKLQDYQEDCNELNTTETEVNIQMISEDDMPESLPANLVVAMMPMITIKE